MVFLNPDHVNSASELEAELWEEPSLESWV